MPTLHVKVKPANPGTVTVHIALSQTPGGSPLNETFTVTKDTPLDQEWTLESALYSVTTSWKSGYQNFSGNSAHNGIIVNDVHMYYQVLGAPGDGNGISAVFGCQL